MQAFDDLKSWTKDTGLKFLDLAQSSLDTPVIGNWCYSRLTDVYVYIMNLYIAEIEVGRWLDSASSSLAQILSWDSIRANITGTWSWINTIDDRIWSTAGSRIRATWSWIDAIDDRIRSTALAQWSWLDTIDDKIRDVAWNHVVSKLGAWLLDWLLLNLTIWGRIGYLVLDKIWNMEWDDARKEVK